MYCLAFEDRPTCLEWFVINLVSYSTFRTGIHYYSLVGPGFRYITATSVIHRRGQVTLIFPNWSRLKILVNYYEAVISIALSSGIWIHTTTSMLHHLMAGSFSYYIRTWSHKEITAGKWTEFSSTAGVVHT